MTIINYPELVARRKVIEDNLKENRDRFPEESGQYQRLSRLMDCANRLFTHAYQTGESEGFDQLEEGLVRSIGNVVSPETARNPRREKQALEWLEGVRLLPN
jgi:hypothetical protein